MKKIINLCLAVVCLFFSSCAKYQFVTLNSECKKDVTRAFIVENDTVRVKYSFNGLNCPVKVELFNKLKKPIYIDWKKSALIMNDEKFSYWIDEAMVNLSTSATEINWSKRVSSTYSETNGTIFKDEKVSFIPPATFIKYSPRTLRNNFFPLPPPESKQKISFAGTGGNGNIVGYEYSFEKGNSPLVFRSYLVLSADENFSTASYLDSQFWVSEIIQVSGDGNTKMNQLSNQFSIKEKEGQGVGCVLVGLVGIALVYAVTQLK